MSVTDEAGSVSAGKRMAAISGLICLLAVASFLLYYYGRQHKVIIDNRTVETAADGKSYRALASARVAVNHATLDPDEAAATAVSPSERPVVSFQFWPPPDPSTAQVVEMTPRERILVKVVGPEFNLKSEAFDKNGESLGTLNTTVHLGLRRDAMVRLVKLHQAMPDYLESYPNDAIARPKPDDDAPPAGGEGDAPLPGFGDG